MVRGAWCVRVRAAPSRAHATGPQPHPPPCRARPLQVTAPGLWLLNGALELAPEQQLLVTAPGARMADLTLRDAPPPLPAASGRGSSGPASLASTPQRAHSAGGAEEAQRGSSGGGGPAETPSRSRSAAGALPMLTAQLGSARVPAVGSAGVGGGSVSGGVGGAGRAAVLVAKMSYAGGGELRLERCELALGGGRGVGLQVRALRQHQGCSQAARST